MQESPGKFVLHFRTLFISALAVIGITVLGNAAVFHRYEILGTGYLPRGVVFFLLFLILYNQTIGRLLPWARLQRMELLIIFCALLAMDTIPAQGFGQHFYLNLAAMTEYTRPDMPAGELNIPSHFQPGMLPATNPSSPVIRWFYESLPEGEGVPYAAWIGPFLIWTPYTLLLYWFLLWCAALISYRWENHERLLFPLMQIPLSTVETPDGAAPSLFRSRLMWGCFLFMCLLYTYIFLTAYFEDLPTISLANNLGRLASGGPMSAFNGILLDFRPEMIGIAYLLTTEVGFSLVFFYFFRRFVMMLRIYQGFPTGHGSFLQFQAAGGYLVLAVAFLYSARGYLRDCARSALRGGPEANFHRLCFFGIVSGFGGLLIWCHTFGISIRWAALQFGLFALASLVASRVICEAGMFLYSSPLFGLGTVMFNSVGAQMAAKDVTLLTATTWTDIRNSSAMAMPFMLQTFKVGAAAGLRRSYTAWLIFGAIVISVLTCHLSAPYIIYQAGVENLAPWPSGSGLNTVNKLARFLTRPESMDAEKWTGLLSGGGTIAFLVIMRQHFLWWPLHPLGFVASLWGWPIDRYWLSIFLGWMVKVFVLRYGGYKAYRALRPAAFGMILGLCFIMTLWMLLHFKWDAPAVIYD